MRAALLFLLISACSIAGPESEMPALQDAQPPMPEVPRRHEALWVFTDEVRSEAARSRLLMHAAQSGVTRLYVSMYQPVENRAGRRLFDERAIRAFVSAAHGMNIEVWLAYGAVSWHVYGCRPGTPPYDRMQDVLGYNRDHPHEAFDGVMLDLEMEEPADLEALLKTYDEILAVLRPAGVRVAGAIRFFWNRPVVRSDGRERPGYEHFIDLDLDHIVVMAYRNFAGGPCPDDGIICLSEDELSYAERRLRDHSIVVGLRTTSVAADGGPPHVTFYGHSPEMVKEQRDLVVDHFGSYRSFGGFAVHQYQSHAL